MHIARHLLNVQTAWQKTTAAIVATGERLKELKRELGSEKAWLEVFQRNRLPFGERTAQMIISIAKHEELSNPHNYAYLPGSLNALYLLSRIRPPSIVKRLIETRAVTSTTTIAEVADLYIFKVPQLVPKLSKIVAAYHAGSVATVAGYELWRETREATGEGLRKAAAWLNELADAIDKEQQEHGAQWAELARKDAREVERQENELKEERRKNTPRPSALIAPAIDMPNYVTVKFKASWDMGDDIRYWGTPLEREYSSDLIRGHALPGDEARATQARLEKEEGSRRRSQAHEESRWRRQDEESWEACPESSSSPPANEDKP